MSLIYSVYGLHLKTNLPLLGLVPLSDPHLDVNSTVHLQGYLGALPDDWASLMQEDQTTWFISSHKSAEGIPLLVVHRWNQRYWRMVYADGVEFVIDQTASQLWATWPPAVSFNDVTQYLLGPVLGFVLRLRKVLCLHASAIEISGHAVAFVGTSGAGKSTTAAIFAKTGFPILSDDIVALDLQPNGVMAHPAYPQLRLWASSVEHLYGSADALPLVTTDWQKQYLDLNQEGYRFQVSPLPLAAIYLLAPRCENTTAHQIESVAPMKGLMDLIRNTYANVLLDPSMRATEFQALGQLVCQVPLRQVTPSNSLAHLASLRDSILADLAVLIAT